MSHLRVTIGHLRVTVGHPRVAIDHLRATMGDLRLTIGYLKATVAHIRVTISHFKVTIGDYRITIGHNFFSISKHKANTSELHPKVRKTCLQILLFIQPYRAEGGAMCHRFPVLPGSIICNLILSCLLVLVLVPGA